jgi:hypothetical protein
VIEKLEGEIVLKSNTEVRVQTGARGWAAGRPDGDDFDDRVLCEWCQQCAEKEMSQSWKADDFEKFRKVNHPAFNWMWDSVKIRNGWARVEWVQRTCEATDLPAMPKDTRHRCHLFADIMDAPVTKIGDREGGAEWWE